ncbi:MAG: hypothetical protein AAB676_10775 [Verrucomicrobiota bacterium]
MKPKTETPDAPQQPESDLEQLHPALAAPTAACELQIAPPLRVPVTRWSQAEFIPTIVINQTQ